MYRHSGKGAAKPRLIAIERLTAAGSRAAKPFISTLDTIGGWFCLGFRESKSTKCEVIYDIIKKMLN
jgi:hypothetical protein